MRIESLINEERLHRTMAEKFSKRAEYHWNKANELLLEIQAEAGNYIENKGDTENE